MRFNRSGRLLTALSCALIVSVAAPVAAHAAELTPAEPVAAESSEPTQSSDVIGELPAGKVNVPYHHQLPFVGNGRGMAGALLPPGLRMGENGVIHGTPEKAGAGQLFKVAEFDSSTGRLIERWFSLDVAEGDRPVIKPGVPPRGLDYMPYSHQVEAITPAGTSPKFTASGLPTGLSISPEGLISGKAPRGTFTVTIHVTARATGGGGADVPGDPVTITIEIAPRGKGFEWTDDSGDRHKIVYDKEVGFGYDTMVHGDCGPGWFLNGREGTPGMDVGKGFLVEIKDRTTTRVTETREVSSRIKGRLPDGSEAIQGSALEVYTLGGTNRVHVEMICTQDPTKAWRG